METNTIKFQENLTELDLPTLKKTVSYELAKGGLKKSAPLEHHQLIDQFKSLISSNTKFQPVLEPIYATERNTLRVMYKGDKEKCPVENYLIQRIFTKINIQEENQKKLNVAIAISYHEKGIQVAYGVNVSICKNLLIFGSNRMSTYGGDSIKYDKMYDVLDDWLKRYEEKKERDYNIVETLQRRKVNSDELFVILGKLIYEAERNNTVHKNGASLNVSQTLRLIDNYNLIYKGGPKIEDVGKAAKPVTAFDILQWGTNNLKPNEDGRDLTQLIDTSNKFSNFIVKELCPEINLN